MPFTIYKETKGARYFKLTKTLHITRDGRAVGELDPEGVRVLGSAGHLVSEEQAKKYKLDASQIESDVEEAYVPPPPPEPQPEPAVIENPGVPPEPEPEPAPPPAPEKKSKKVKEEPPPQEGE